MYNKQAQQRRLARVFLHHITVFWSKRSLLFFRRSVLDVQRASNRKYGAIGGLVFLGILLKQALEMK
jgi:hypothetical protein